MTLIYAWNIVQYIAYPKVTPLSAVQGFLLYPELRAIESACKSRGLDLTFPQIPRFYDHRKGLGEDPGVRHDIWSHAEYIFVISNGQLTWVWFIEERPHIIMPSFCRQKVVFHAFPWIIRSRGIKSSTTSIHLWLLKKTPVMYRLASLCSLASLLPTTV